MWTYANPALPQITHTISANQEDYNVHNAVGNPTYPVILVLNVNSGVTVGGVSNPALRLDNFHSKSRIIINNNGTIYGYGGDGGNGGSNIAAQAGGHAIFMNTAYAYIELNNSGTGDIRGGGGGGGGGASREASGGVNLAGGGGGGGGQGYGTSIGGSGADGGNPGSSADDGQDGTNGSTAGPGSGGAGGTNASQTGGAGAAGAAWATGGNTGQNGSGGLIVAGPGAGGAAGKAVWVTGGSVTVTNNSGTIMGVVD